MLTILHEVEIWSRNHDGTRVSETVEVAHEALTHCHIEQSQEDDGEYIHIYDVRFDGEFREFEKGSNQRLMQRLSQSSQLESKEVFGILAAGVSS